MKTHYTNTNSHPVHIGNVLVMPGETREVFADQIPAAPDAAPDKKTVVAKPVVAKKAK